MLTPHFKYAELDEKGLKKVQQLEEITGAVVVAVQAQYPFAELPEAQVRRIQELEQELGVVLLAYRP